MDIVIQDLAKSFGEKQILRQLSAVIQVGACTGIMGRSGCGKTTLLRILMGLEQADEGRISGLPEAIAAVFQEDRLCEGFSAVQNVYAVMNRWNAMQRQALADQERLPKERKIPLADRERVAEGRKILSGQRKTLRADKRSILEKIEKNLSMVGLGDSLHLPVRELSGGMKRRVAIVRACMAESELLLLDEPFRGLDQETKKRAADYILRKSAGKTVILTTHDELELQLMESRDVIRL